jgi:hypothetical protein
MHRSFLQAAAGMAAAVLLAACTSALPASMLSNRKLTAVEKLVTKLNLPEM